MLFRLLERLKIFRPVEAFLVYWFDHSILSRQRCGEAGTPPVPTFTLTTIGRRSGDRVSTPLFYFRDDDAYVVIGSTGGRPKHPAWFLNLEADSHAWVRTRRRSTSVRAKVLTGAERERMWNVAVPAYPFYAKYAETAAPRQIPVVRLNRVKT